MRAVSGHLASAIVQVRIQTSTRSYNSGGSHEGFSDASYCYWFHNNYSYQTKLQICEVKTGTPQPCQPQVTIVVAAEHFPRCLVPTKRHYVALCQGRHPRSLAAAGHTGV